jgi:hypothetical protein
MEVGQAKAYVGDKNGPLTAFVWVKCKLPVVVAALIVRTRRLSKSEESLFIGRKFWRCKAAPANGL